MFVFIMSYQNLVEEINNYHYVQYLKKSSTTKKTPKPKPQPLKKPPHLVKKQLTTKDVSLPRKLTSTVTKDEDTKSMVSQTSRRSNHDEDKVSLLLTKQENELIIKLLGERCRTLSTSVVQLFMTSPPDHNCWILRDTGVLCFVKDNARRAYFFRIYCPLRKRLLWQQEMYTPFEYRNPRPFLHTFEADDCMVAFNFSNEDEASDCYNIVTQTRLRQERRTRNSMQSGRSNSTANIQQSASASQWNVSNGNSSNPYPTQHQRSNSAGGEIKPTFKQSLGKKRNKNLTTRDISAPSDFKHISHVGWNANSGFDFKDVVDENLRKFFKEAGVSAKQLDDRETRNFIYDFLEKNGGMDAIRQNGNEQSSTDSAYPVQPPPVPARVIPQQRAAPAPPSRIVRAPSSRVAPSLPSKPPPITPNVPPPPPPISNAFIPPPPPPPPPMTGLLTPPVMNGLPVSPPPEPPKIDSKSALLDSIKVGVKLKPVDPNKKPDKPDVRSDLLSEIRQGVELRSVVTNAQRPVSTQNAHGLAGALARALAERSRAIHSDSDTSDTSSDDEWGED